MENENMITKEYTKEELKSNDKTIEFCDFIVGLFTNIKEKFDKEKMKFDKLELKITFFPLSERYSLVTNVNLVSSSEQVQAESLIDFTPVIIDFEHLFKRLKLNKNMSRKNLKVEYDDCLDLRFLEIFRYKAKPCRIMETKIIVKQSIFCPELWMDDEIDIRKDFAPVPYGPSPTNSFYDLQDPEEGYLLRGVGAVPRGRVLDREHDYY